MKPSRWKQWQQIERERRKKKTPSGRRREDLPAWQVAAKKVKLGIKP